MAWKVIYGLEHLRARRAGPGAPGRGAAGGGRSDTLKTGL